MKDLLPLTRSKLFEGIKTQELGKLLDCIAPRHKKYRKGSFVFVEEDDPAFIGMVLSGLLHIVRDDYWGNRTIVTQIEPGELFAEAFVCGGVHKIPVSVTAAKDTEIIQFDFNRITTLCSSACAFHSGLVKNMLSILAQKNMRLMDKLECLTQRGTRAKVLHYLSTLAKRQKSAALTIPFNRQELADYLSVDRSALSAELCRMRNEGILSFRKNHFFIKEK